MAATQCMYTTLYMDSMDDALIGCVGRRKSSNAGAERSEEYPDAKEEVDPTLANALGTPLETIVFSGADFAHDCILPYTTIGHRDHCFVGSTAVHWISNRQGCIATSTYACCTACRCKGGHGPALHVACCGALGVPVTDASEYLKSTSSETTEEIPHRSSLHGLLPKSVTN